MREKLNKTTILIILCTVFLNLQNVALAGVSEVPKTNIKQPVPTAAATKTKSNVNTVKANTYIQKPKTLQLMPKISTQPPLPNAANKITVNPAPVLTLNNYIKSYQKPYLNVYISALTTLSDSQTVTSYNSSKGEIKTRLKNGKELYVLVVPFQNNVTKVRITPANGVYDIPAGTVGGIFAGINTELTKN